MNHPSSGDFLDKVAKRFQLEPDLCQGLFALQQDQKIVSAAKVR